MPEMIRDGSGKGNLAKVNANQRLYTRAVTQAEEVLANEAGRAFNLNTGIVTLTDSVDTPLIYIKNNEDENLVISAVAIGIGPSTGGTTLTDMTTATFIRNPTTGTVITDTPTNVPINSNRNYGSARTLTADVFLGATGDTMTDGDDHIFVFLGTSARAFIAINEILPKGSSFGIKINPLPGNSSQQMYVAVICYLRDANE